MNLLEHYVQEMHSAKEIDPEIVGSILNSNERHYVVDITSNCYGFIKRDEYVFSQSELDDIYAKKVFLA